MWNLTLAKEDGFFYIEGEDRLYINCNGDQRSASVSGRRPQAFLPEFQGNTNYELVEQGSGLFLRITNQKTLERAPYDQSIEEQFSLVPV